MEPVDKIALIVAGGYGRRMGSSIPKQFLLLNGRPLLYYSIRAFLDAFPGIRIILVLPAEHTQSVGSILSLFDKAPEIRVVTGGETRFQSVKNGLEVIKERSVIFVHDGVRPLISPALIRSCYHGALEKGSAIPAVDLKESIREVSGEDNRAADRSRFKVIQTPQAFRSEILLPAFGQVYSPLFTDEASVVEAYGFPVHLVPGEERNLKITGPSDLAIAERLMQD